jgi:hypothetical protein
MKGQTHLQGYMCDGRSAIPSPRIAIRQSLSGHAGQLPAGGNPVSHLWTRRVVVTGGPPQLGSRRRELTVTIFIIFAALLALPALGQAARVIVHLLAWLIAIAFVMALGILVLLEVAKHAKLL